MTPLDRLHGLGVKPLLIEGKNLHLDRPEDITDETWEQAVSLAKQNKAAIVAALKGGTVRGTQKRILPSMLRAWRTARPWILENLQELEAKGWTRKRLFRADVFSYPHGAWGPAWSRNWLREGVTVEVDEWTGAIRWTWMEPTGRTMTQASRPR